MIPLFRVFMTQRARDLADRVLCSGYVGQGKMVDDFEARLSERMALRRVLTVNSCTSALDLALHLIGVGPGDDVLTTPQTCTATNGGIVTRGARPVWCDIDPATGNIDPDDVAKRITLKTKAIMAVDWGGRACEYDELRRHGIPVIEDAAHAFDTKYRGQHVAKTGGDYVCHSFQAIKHLTTGDGGSIVVPDDEYDRARLLRWYGLDRTGSASFRCEQDIKEVGYKWHMNDIAAAVGLGNLEEIDFVLAGHVANAHRYCLALSGIRGLRVPTFDPNSSWWIYSMLVDDPKIFMSEMKQRGIDTSPVHARNDKHTAFRAASLSADLPGVDEFTAGHVAIPVGWWLSEDDVEKIIVATAESVEIARTA